MMILDAVFTRFLYLMYGQSSILALVQTFLYDGLDGALHLFSGTIELIFIDGITKTVGITGTD